MPENGGELTRTNCNMRSIKKAAIRATEKQSFSFNFRLVGEAGVRQSRRVKSKAFQNLCALFKILSDESYPQERYVAVGTRVCCDFFQIERSILSSQ
jgi:hypothetical protein